MAEAWLWRSERGGGAMVRTSECCHNLLASCSLPGRSRPGWSRARSRIRARGVGVIAEARTRRAGVCRKGTVLLWLGVMFLPVYSAGCGGMQWLRNGFLDPTQVGRFTNHRRNEIRHTLSILEEPPGIQNTVEPTSEDLEPYVGEMGIAAGDIVNVSIYELRTPLMETQLQLRVGNSGFETIPQLGPVPVVGLTSRELELELNRRLREAEILPDADVQVSVVQSEANQFSILGNVTRPGVYPLPGPKYFLLNAIAAAGGIPATTQTIYVFQRTQSKGGTADSLGRASAQPARARSGVEERYTLSDVSSGPAGADRGNGRVDVPATGKSGVDELEVLRRGALQGQPEVEWDQEAGRWVILAPQTQGARDAEPIEDGPSGGRDGAPRSAQPSSGVDTQRVDDESAPWDVPDELASPMRIIEIPVKPLLDGDPRYNIAMRPYDMINVPLENVGNYSMMGNVARPGAYTLAGQRLTVKEAIAAAGGFGPLAWPSRAELVRRISGDEEQIIQLDLDAIFSGEAPDFYLKPNDIVNVGTTPAATFFAVVRNAFRFTYGMGFVYDRNFADSDSFGAREQVKNRRNQEAQLRGIPF